MKKQNPASGFTLIEVLVSLALLMGTMFIGIELFRQSQEQIRNQEIGLAVEALGRTIRQKVQYPNTCNTSFSFINTFSVADASTPAGVPVRLIIDPTNNISILDGAMDIEGINVLSFRLTNLTAIDLVSPTRKYSGLLKLSAEKTKNLLGGKALRERAVGAIVIETNAAGVYMGCYVDNSPGYSCAAMGGTYKPGETPPCQFSMSLGACTNANEYLVGFNAGVPICKTLDGACPAGKYLIGISPAGIVCSP